MGSYSDAAFLRVELTNCNLLASNARKERKFDDEL